MGFFSNIFRKREPVAPSDHPFPDLYTFELKFDEAIRTEINQQVYIPMDTLAKEKWDYLRNKYWQLIIPITHEYHVGHDFQPIDSMC